MNTPLYQRADLGAVFLPIGNMLQIDRVTDASDAHITCELDLAEHWVFPMHFPNDSIFPGSLLIEAAGQAVAIWGWHQGLRGKPRMANVSAEFSSPIVPTDLVVTFNARVRQRKNMCLGKVEITAAGRKTAAVQTMIVILPE